MKSKTEFRVWHGEPRSIQAVLEREREEERVRECERERERERKTRERERERERGRENEREGKRERAKARERERERESETLLGSPVKVVPVTAPARVSPHGTTFAFTGSLSGLHRGSGL